MLSNTSQIILGILLIFGKLDSYLHNFYDLTCGIQVADMGCSIVSAFLISLGGFLIIEGLFNLYNYWNLASIDWRRE